MKHASRARVQRRYRGTANLAAPATSSHSSADSVNRASLPHMAADVTQRAQRQSRPLEGQTSWDIETRCCLVHGRASLILFVVAAYGALDAYRFGEWRQLLISLALAPAFAAGALLMLRFAAQLSIANPWGGLSLGPGWNAPLRPRRPEFASKTRRRRLTYRRRRRPAPADRRGASVRHWQRDPIGAIRR